MDSVQASNARRKTLLVLSCILLAVGNCGGPLLTRLYFVHGGKRTWLSSWVTTAGWPITVIPLIISYLARRKTKGRDAKLIHMKLPTFIASAVLGVVTSPANFMYAFGVGHLPVSTSTLIGSTQLAFTAFFAFIIVRQKFTQYSINTIVLLTVGTTTLALRANSDKPKGESNRLYVLGFVTVFGTSMVNGLFYPLMELVYKKTDQAVSYTLVMEVQMVLGLFGTAFTTVAMLINNDFKAMPTEAREFELGEAIYYVILVSTAIAWQLLVVGAMGTLFSTSALVIGIMTAVLLPVSEVLAVVFYHEKFGGEKGVSLALSLWGFASYLYGERNQSKQKTLSEEIEMTRDDVVP